MLSADGVGGGVALESGLDEEEGRAGGGADYAGGGTAEHVDGERLGILILVKQTRYGLTHGVVEAQAAAVEEHLVDVGAADTAIDASQALVSHDYADTLDGVAVVLDLCTLMLKLSLQLHSMRYMC